MSIDIPEEITRAIAAAAAVTRLVQTRLDEIREVTKDDRSPVTVADFAAQAIIAHRLNALEPPQVSLVGEENSDALRESRELADEVVNACRYVWPEASLDTVIAAIDAGNHDATGARYWTLDPIDGTKGFLRGGQYAISLGLIEDGEVVLGALGCPNLSSDHSHSLLERPAAGTLFVAAKGQGAEQYLLADGAIDLDSAAAISSVRDGTTKVRLCESVEAAHSKHDITEKIIASLNLDVASVRLDSQCKYAVVARGQADVYLRVPTRKDYVERIWDHAAGMLVATEAGAIVTDVDGNALDFRWGQGLEKNRGVVCAHPDFHATLIDAIAGLEI